MTFRELFLQLLHRHKLLKLFTPALDEDHLGDGFAAPLLHSRREEEFVVEGNIPRSVRGPQEVASDLRVTRMFNDFPERDL